MTHLAENGQSATAGFFSHTVSSEPPVSAPAPTLPFDCLFALLVGASSSPRLPRSRIDLIVGEISFRETRTRGLVSRLRYLFPRRFFRELAFRASDQRVFLPPSLLLPSRSSIIRTLSSPFSPPPRAPRRRSAASSSTRGTRTLARTLLSRRPYTCTLPSRAFAGFSLVTSASSPSSRFSLSLLTQVSPRKLAAETFETRCSLQPTCRLLGHQRDGPPCYGRPRRVRGTRGALPVFRRRYQRRDIYFYVRRRIINTRRVLP